MPLRSRARALSAVAAVIGAGIAVGLWLQPDARSAGPRVVSYVTPGAYGHAQKLPAPVSGFAVPQPRTLGRDAHGTRWAPVLRGAVARRQPNFSSPAATGVSTRTPEGTTNIVVADRETTRDGMTWVRTRLASLPNGLVAWIPRQDLGGWTFVFTRVVVNRARMSLTLYRNGRPIFRAPVGVGASSSPTPAGHFYVRDRLTGYASPEYGPLAFGTSARSAYETGWPAGGFIGIHGTDRPSLIPGHISHGCIRLRNSAIRTLGRLMPVGTPVTIE